MKKFLAMLLAAMMLLSSVGAMAEVQDDSTLKIKPAVNSRFYSDSTTEGEVDTELWLQVAADGQIDVTVPLVLIFSTNVDGGKATEANNYKIVNNNDRSSISVDKIEVKRNDNNSHMTLVDSNNTGWNNTTRDQYYVTLKPSTTYTGSDATANDVLETQVYDLYIAANTQYSKNGENEKSESLFRIGENSSVKLTANMVTTPLTFVTGITDEANDTYLIKGEGEADAANSGKGIELLTITYTVALEYDTVESKGITENSELIRDTDYENPDYEHGHEDY